MNLVPNRKSQQQLLVTTCVVHCGCGYAAANNDAAWVIQQAILHNDETGHVCHFQGEVRPLSRKAVTQ